VLILFNIRVLCQKTIFPALKKLFSVLQIFTLSRNKRFRRYNKYQIFVAYVFINTYKKCSISFERRVGVSVMLRSMPGELGQEETTAMD